jgi:hypothetical protein
MRDLGRAISVAFSKPNCGLTKEEAEAVKNMEIKNER